MQTYKGVITKGTKRAGALGYPTINILLTDASVTGIFAARVKVDDTTHQAAAFAGPGHGILEAHLLDFPPRDLYEKEAVITLFKKIRDSEHFTDDTLLKKAIVDDVRRVREYFAGEKGANSV